MSPKLYIGDKLIAVVPDNTGLYKAKVDGSPLGINVDPFYLGENKIFVTNHLIAGR